MTGGADTYYSYPVTPGSSVQITVDGMNVDVDLAVYSDANYLYHLCLSQNEYTNADSCTITVPAGVNTLYIMASGQYATNNRSWLSGTEQLVGAMFRLSIL